MIGGLNRFLAASKQHDATQPYTTEDFNSITSEILQALNKTNNICQFNYYKNIPNASLLIDGY
jgi:hypothetical protein